MRKTLWILCGTFIFGLGAGVFAAADESAVMIEQDFKRTELKIAIEKQRGILQQAEAKSQRLEVELEGAKQAYQSSIDRIGTFETGNEQTRGLYYKETQTKLLSQSGHFYDQELVEKKDAEQALKEAEKAYDKSLKNWTNEKRLFLERVQRLRDYEESIAEKSGAQISSESEK